MVDVALSLVPVFLVIVSGHAAKRLGFLADSFWIPAEKLTYYVLFPALLVTTTAGAEFTQLPVAAIATAMIVGSTLNPVILLALRKPLAVSGPTFSSLIQGAIRPNTYIGLAASYALAGEQGLALVAVCVVVNIPLVNLWSVIALVRFAGAGRSNPGGWRMALPILRNPLIVACLVGGALNVSGIGLPPVVEPYLGILGRASLPIALLAVGAGLDFKTAKTRLGVTAAAGVFKLLVLPAVVWVTGYMLGIDGAARTIVIMFSALPTSASSYVLARQMGGDAPVMAGIITASTLLAMVTMPLLVAYLP